MSKIQIDTINEMVSKYLQSTECKEQLKKNIVDFLENDECGYFEIDQTTKSVLNEADWKEIAETLGEDITVVGNLVFTNDGIVTSNLWNKYISHKRG